jgi:spore maturation protein CgeB
MIDEISTYRVALNKSIDIDIPYRVFESTACGLPLVTNNVPDIEKLFKIGEEIIVYDSNEQMKS